MMNIIRIISVIMSSLLIGAHFLRAGSYPLVLLALGLPLILLLRNTWATRILQILLVLAGIEWIRTVLVLVAERRAVGHPWIRLAIILGVVAAFTIASALMLRARENKSGDF
jgi:hypothetical protein